ncbi:MAG: ABC transporter permease [Phascolarctobacterium sp.]|nr:ABC transporter permease [Phascolarctobacterium sp.]
MFEELVKRDFKQKYKRTALGMLWSILSPLLMMCVLATIFGNFFGKSIEHYIVYLFSGQVIFNYYTESTNGGMNALMSNAKIFTKINVPKYLFLFSKNVSALINFGIILLVYFVFVWLDGITFTWKFLTLVYPIVCLIFINLGMGLILSALFIFFRDIEYLYRLFTQVVMYGCAIFYSIDRLPQHIQNVFYCNPIFVCITYFRSVVINDTIPELWLHALLAGYAIVLFGAGCYVYKKYNYKFLYYV